MTTNDEIPTTADEYRTKKPPRVDHEEGDDRTDEPTEWIDTLALERRSYLRSIGAVGALGSLTGFTGATGGVAAQDDDRDWEAAADERIETYRTGDLEVVVEDESGEPIAGADVDVEMRAHDFGFGVALSAPRVLEESADADQYREHVPELFNKAVLGNHHKWRFWEENRETADEATQWALDQGLDVRGHTCIWSNRDAYAVPADVEDAIDEGDAEHIRERSLEHIEEIITHYGDDIEEWDVVNEAVHEYALVEGVYGDAVDDDPWEGEVVPWQSPLLAEWYERAQAVAEQEGVGIAVNDYNTLVGPHDYARDWYRAQIEFLLEEGIDLDGIGMQCHFGVDERLTPEEILAGLDLYADYGAELRATEFDTFQGEWSREQQADYLYEFLKTFFSHPQTQDFVMWGFWDGDHWGESYGEEDDAPLFTEDWEPKPAYDRYVELVFEEWWTDEAGSTGADGTYATTAFLGEHELTVDTGEETITRTVDVTDADRTTTVTVTGDGETGSGEGPPSIDGYQPADTTGDGLYNDITGSGSTTTTDVNVFFEHVDDPAVAEYPQYYDFDGNGRVTVTDVVELFDSL
ncbi:endo-1,4-beta-xylanase [Natronoglomus mannanivorans]|uniref:endo-1,4-beta-xylanase n=1 Tax=Natronoglomus mannanivorans TaxID=2979990 RepID=A0AAP3E110_9EURY|nr:endo-1,4-beta-xylanase [Halobacteria archaeon AArc-xg1-1]